MRRVLRSLETHLALAGAFALVFLLPFRVLAKLLGTSRPAPALRPAPLPADGGAAVGRALARRVERLARRFPARATCLVQAVALWLLLRRRGFAARVRLGVRQDKGVLEAHAWVEMAGATVMGGEAASGFTAIADLGVRAPSPGTSP